MTKVSVHATSKNPERALMFIDLMQNVLDQQTYVDVESGEPISGKLILPLYGVRILKRKAI